MEDDNNTACKLQFTQDKMTDKRLKEIKTSIDFQVTATKACGYDETLINEEVELYNYISELKHTEELYNQLLKEYDDLIIRIEKAIEYIKKETKDMPVNGCRIRLNEVLDILNGRNDE